VATAFYGCGPPCTPSGCASSTINGETYVAIDQMDVVVQDGDVASLMNALCSELPPAQAARIAARVTHRPRNELYDYAVKHQRRQ